MYNGTFSLIDPLYSPLPGMPCCCSVWLASRGDMLGVGVGSRPIGVGVGIAGKPCVGEAVLDEAPNCYVICTAL